MVCTIDAAEGPVRERVDFWRSILRDRLDISALVAPIGTDDFAQSVTVAVLGDVVLAERRGSPFHAWRTARDDSDRVVAMVNLEGHFYVDSHDKGATALAPGSMLVFPLANAGELRFVEPTRHLVISFPSHRLAENYPEWRDTNIATLNHWTAPARMLSELAQALLQHSEGLGAHCLCAGGEMLASLVASTLSAREEGESSQSTRMREFHMQRIRNFVLTHLCDPTLDATSIADAVGLSLRYVHRLFTNESLPLMHWVLEQRLRRCHEALQSQAPGNESISQIAYRLGFNDAAHFSRAFRKRFGRSPREVAEEARRRLN